MVTSRLTHVGTSRPAAVRNSAGGGLTLLTIFATLLLLRLAYTTVRDRERRLGRFEPLVPVDRIDRSWLEQNVFNVPPEIVGASWDKHISGPEVAAVIGRMVSEGKLNSWTSDNDASTRELHLQLLVPREELKGYERELVESLFPEGRSETSTTFLETYYQYEGFNPASLIRTALKARSDQLVADAEQPVPVFLRWPVLAILVAGTFVVIGFTVSTSPLGSPVVVQSLGFTTVLMIIAGAMGAVGRSAVDSTGSALRQLVAVMALNAMFLGALTLLITMSVAGLLAVHLIALVAALIVMRLSLMTDSPERLALRKRLAAGRRYLDGELKKEHPALEDAWFPWILAFGLGPTVDQWFRSFGGTASTDSGSRSRSLSSSGSGGWSGAGGGWSGGGGAFGGAGATSAWVSAANHLAGGVAGPASSGSSGGFSGGGGGGGRSSSGGSSGGGGGGGW